MKKFVIVSIGIAAAVVICYAVSPSPVILNAPHADAGADQTTNAVPPNGGDLVAWSATQHGWIVMPQLSLTNTFETIVDSQGTTNATARAAFTNGLVNASITNGLVHASITNGLVNASITNGLVRPSDLSLVSSDTNLVWIILQSTTNYLYINSTALGTITTSSGAGSL